MYIELDRGLGVSTVTQHVHTYSDERRKAIEVDNMGFCSRHVEDKIGHGRGRGRASQLPLW
jgi:hypothetical protein